MNTITLGRNEARVIPLLWLGDETRLEYAVTLAEPGASVRFIALLLGQYDQACRLRVNVTHAAAHTTSEIIIKSVLAGRSMVTIDGLATIRSGSKGAKTWLAAHTLLLSNQAKGVATPGLEIMESDVTAGHAATVGRADEEQLFYLMSRGLCRTEAEKLIVWGFVQDMLDVFPAVLTRRVARELQR